MSDKNKDEDNQKELEEPIKMDCKLCRNLAHKYIRGTFDEALDLREEIICHLAACADCLKYYKDISLIKDNKEFLLYEEIIDLKLKLENSGLYTSVGYKLKTEKNNIIKLEFIKDSKSTDWELAHKKNSIQTLMRLKAFTDLILECSNYKGNKNTENLNKFYSYLTKNICIGINHLEQCFKLDINSNKS